MQYTKQQLSLADIILRKLSDAELSVTDSERLSQWLDESEDNRRYYRQLLDNVTLEEFDHIVGQFDIPEIWERVSQSVKSRHSRKRRVFAWLGVAGVAAAVMLAVIFQFLWKDGRQTIVSQYAHPELTMPDGSRFVLNNEGVNATLKPQGIFITEESNLSLVDFKLPTENAEQRVFVSLAVPVGGDYSMILPDGTNVKLNSKTTLRFPSDFGQTNREVWLEGEGYFRVMPNADKPFVIHSGEVNTTVLGTAFNVSAYDSDGSVQTTLVEGAVRVECHGDGLVLEPGQQSVFDRGSESLSKREVDTSIYTSWMDGKLYFVGYKLEDIVDKLQRWYDFEMNYSSEDLRTMRFSGTINKNNPLNDLFRFLEETGSITFKVKGSTVTASRSE